MRHWRSTLTRIGGLDWPTRLLLLEALGWLAAVRLAILLLPFKVIAPYVGQHQQETPQQIAPVLDERARKIGWAVRAAAARTPWESACLAQAIAAQRMLYRQRIPGTLYLGVTTDAAAPGKLKAHAWLRCGSLILTGAASHRHYTVVSTFARYFPEPDHQKSLFSR